MGNSGQRVLLDQKGDPKMTEVRNTIAESTVRLTEEYREAVDLLLERGRLEARVREIYARIEQLDGSARLAQKDSIHQGR